MDEALFTALPYIVRLSHIGEPPNVHSVYEVYNTETKVVEDRLAVLPNACRAAKLYAVALEEAMTNSVDVTWDVTDDEEDV